MLDPKAFIALEASIAATAQSRWSKLSGQIINDIAPLLEQNKWDDAYDYVDRITLNGVVDQGYRKLEELAVSSLLFGAQNVTGDIQQTGLVQGRSEIPSQAMQALEQYRTVVEVTAADNVRNSLRLLIHTLSMEAVTKMDGLHTTLNQAPRPFYIMRPLLNADTLIDWAASQGFTSTLAPDDMHVTVMYSRKGLNWVNLKADAPAVVAKGGPRTVEQFGKATVLCFESPSLEIRHVQLRASGASFDFDQYRPHVTLTYEGADHLDLSDVEPFTGGLSFGEEVISPIKADWADDLVEVLTKAELSLADRLNAAVMQGTSLIDVGANLTTSRLVSLGFLAEAIDQQITTYQVNEVLDDVTCPVCQHMHGQTFDVSQEYSRLVTVLSVQDAKQLRSLAPWPSQTRDGLKKLRSMTAAEMQAAGYGSPPYHPGCRGHLSIAGTVTVEAKTPPAIEPAVTFQEADADRVMRNWEDLYALAQGISLTAMQTEAIDLYTGNLYAGLNRGLRKGMPKGAENADVRAYYRKYIRHLDNAIAKGVVEKPVTLYRGVVLPEDAFGVTELNQLVGKTITDKGYMSLTGSLNVAKGFSGYGGAVLEIRVPAGLGMVVPEAIDGVLTGAEREVIMARGLSLEITGVSQQSDPPRIFATIKMPTKTTVEIGTETTTVVQKDEVNRFVWRPGDVTVARS